MVIARVWHGWTTPAQAGIYEALLKGEIFPGILAKRISGLLRIDLLRREMDEQTEFMTVMWFASPEAVTAFVGEDHGAAYVPASARQVLARFDARAVHYEVRERLETTPAGVPAVD
jgi:heme-degrading monooxygenase HmoA